MSTQQYLYNIPQSASTTASAFDHPYRTDRSTSISGSSGSAGSPTSSCAGPLGERSPPFSGLNCTQAISPQDSFSYAAYSSHHIHTGTGSIGIPGSSSSPTISLMSCGPNSASTIASNYSLHSSRQRYYLSKSFDIEDDLEFCPDIPESHAHNGKRFNPYTASIFSPSQESVDPSCPLSPAIVAAAGAGAATASSRSHTPHTPRTKKALDIVNPQTRMRVASPSIHHK